MNRRGFELAISTMVLLVLGVVLLIGLIYVITNGFDRFGSSTEPFVQTSESMAVKQACSLACDTRDSLAYCCQNFTVGDMDVRCDDPRLELSCDLSCAATTCAR